MFEILPFWTANLSVDFMWNKMNSNITGFIHPQRYTGWAAAATSFDFDRIKIQASLLGTYVHDKTLEVDYNSGTKKKIDVKKSKHKWTPSLIISWQPLSYNKDIHLRAFYKNIFRMPTFSEMHLAYMGNLSSLLRPEYARQYNIGITYSKQVGNVGIEVQTDAYYNKITDKLVAMPTGGQFRWTMMNLGEVKIKGIDFNLKLHTRIKKDLTFGARLNYTYQKAQDYTMEVESDTIKYKGQIPYIPWHSGSVIANIGYKTWSINYSFIYTGERYSRSANEPIYKQQEWYTHDLSVHKSFFIRSNRCNATMEVNNIFNQQYDVVENYPMPGTNFKFIFSITI
jgi:outer membrane receptor protein involved in Fe transport